MRNNNEWKLISDCPIEFLLLIWEFWGDTKLTDWKESHKWIRIQVNNLIKYVRKKEKHNFPTLHWQVAPVSLGETNLKEDFY